MKHRELEQAQGRKQALSLQKTGLKLQTGIALVTTWSLAVPAAETPNSLGMANLMRAQHLNQDKGEEFFPTVTILHVLQEYDLVDITKSNDLAFAHRALTTVNLNPFYLCSTGRILNHGHYVCSTWGNYHFKTFDGHVYQFPGLCSYNLASDCQEAYKEFSVHIQRATDSGHPLVEQVIITIKDIVLQLKSNLVVVNGVIAKTPYYSFGILIDKNDAYIKVFTKIGLTLMWNREDAIMVELDSRFNNNTCGLCGDYNGNPIHNEFISEGMIINPVAFGNQQNIHNPNDQCTDPDETKIAETSHCSTYRSVCEQHLGQAAFSDCHSLLDMESYIQTCMLDMCACGNSQDSFCLCSTISEFSRQCSHSGGRPENWRSDSFCSKQCPQNMIYQESASPCMNTCSHLEIHSLCEEHYMDGCFCPAGTVLDDRTGKGCVPVSECHCTHSGVTYAPGQTMQNDCDECRCLLGRWSCTNNVCPGVCAIEGGAHFTSFDERKFTFHGDCYYVLSKGTRNESNAILGELAPCSSSERETCLKTVILLTDNMKNILTFKADGTVLLNQLKISLPHVTATFSIIQPSNSYIIVEGAYGMQMQIQLLPMMQLYITMQKIAKGHLQGLCGNFNSKEGDDFLTSGGLVEATASAFINTWKAQPTCGDKVDWLEDPCSISIESKNYAEYWCSHLEKEESPFAKCHCVVNPTEYAKRCRYDACNCKDSEACMCAAISSYVRACAAKGIILWGWRNGICDKDVTTCPSTQVYLYNLTTCQSTCRSLEEGEKACGNEFTAVDGCGCPDGEYLNEKNHCVPRSKCSCYYNGRYYNPLEVIYKQNERCSCHDGRFICTSHGNETCPTGKVFFDCNKVQQNSSIISVHRSCQTLNVELFQTGCISGCVCPDGLLDNGKGGCVKADQCPCVHNNHLHDHGAKIKVDCNTCTCRSGQWTCTDVVCYGTCTIYGNGHYVTFDNKLYDFDGNCEYVAAQDYCGSNGSFSVITENVPCGTTGVTCSKAIKVFLGKTELKLADKEVEIIQVDSDKQVQFLTREVGIYLVIQASNDILLIWDKRTTIFIKVSPAYKGKLCGLCGNFDDTANNDFTTSHKLPVTSVLEFGNSWKVNPSCPDVSTEIHPCLLTPHRKAWAEKQCELIKSEVFKVCHSKVDPAPFYDACVHDACSCDAGGDCECFCTAVAVYAQECTKAEACVFWRTPDVCPIFCDYYNPKDKCEWHYHPCGNHSVETCRSINNVYTNVTVTYLEGCYPSCPPERPVYDEDKKICVTKEECGCYINGTHYEPDTPIPTDENCRSCVCTLQSTDNCTFDQTACFCIVDDVKYNDSDIISSKEESGVCIVQTCVNTTIQTDITLCQSTTPVFETSIPVVTTLATTTTKVTTTTPSSSTTCAYELVCEWGQWFDVNKPGDGLDSGDYETYDEIKKHGHQICGTPEDIQCRAASAPDVSLDDLGQKVHCNVSYGLICNNNEQMQSSSLWQKCYNYEIQVKCCSWQACPSSTTSTTTTPKTTTSTIPTTTTTTEPTTSSTPTTTTTTEPTTETFPTTTSKTTPPESTTTPITTPTPTQSSTVTQPTTTSVTPTTTTEVPTTTECVTEETEDTTPILTTTTPIPTTTTSTPTTTTPIPTTTTSTPTTTTPIPTTTTPIPTTTTDCTPICSWSPWYDVSYPKYGVNGGDFETYENIKNEGFSICDKPQNISCRASKFPDTPLDELGQKVTCDVTHGLVCNNRDQEGFMPVCYNYEISVECCGDLPPWCTTTTPVKTTTTTTEKTTTPQSTTTPGSTTTTERTTTTPQSTSTPGSTTPTTESTTSTPQSTTITEITTTSPTTTTERTTTTPQSTTITEITTTSPTTTTESTTSTTQSTTTPVSTTSPTITFTTECTPICEWSPWYDVSYPQYGVNGGDFETYENIKNEGFSICDKPQNISCRASKFPDTPLDELGQKVTCDVNHGLVCNNRDQEGFMPVCYNYEISVECCDLPPWCTTTTPVPTTTTTTEKTTTTPQSTTTPGSTTTTERTTTTPQSTSTPVSTTTTEGTTTTPQSTTTPVSTTTTTEGTTSTPQSTTTPEITTTSPTTESTTSTTQSTTTPVSTTTTTEGTTSTIQSTTTPVSTTTTPQSTTTPVSTTTTTESTTTTPQSTTITEITTTSTTTTESTSTTQSTTTSVPTTTECIPFCEWSPWYDVSYPKYDVNGGDFETYENIKNEGFSICDKPQNISCRASKFPDTSLDELGQKVTCDVNHGLVCNNRDQEGFMPVCYNYEISVLCCDLPSWCTTTTPVPTTTTTTEKTTTTPQSTTTPRPTTTTERTTTTPQSTSTPVSTTTTEGTTTTPQSTTTPVSTTTTTEGTTSTPQSTTTPEITTTSPTTESTTSTTQSTTTPVSTTTTTEGTTSTIQSTTTPVSTTTTPQSTTTPVSTTTTTESTTTTPPSTTITEITTTSTTTTESTASTTQSTTTLVPTTTECIPVCEWSPWYDVSYPQYGVNGGDFETYENIKNEGFSICDKPQNISCRASKFPDTSLDELGQKVTCDVNHGFVCNNRDQEGFMPVCYNYEISVLCCDLPSWCTTTTPVPTTTTTTEKTTTTPQSTTTPGSTPTTERTTTTPQSTYTPVSTTTTEGTTTTPQSTTTPVSTTTTTEGTTSTPQSTTTPEITTTSPTTESTTSTTQSTTTPVSTTTTTEGTTSTIQSTTTPVSTTTTPQSTTTPVSTTTTTESTTTTPQSTTITEITTTSTTTTESTSTTQSTTTSVPTTTECIPFCEWSPWYDVSYPKYGVNGGDFETYENIKNEGFSICDKPQNISCRASKFPDTSLDELGQKVTCDVNHGLVCNNRDQEGFMPVCYNYEISVECCDLPSWCTTTTTVPTTTTTTEKTTTTPQSTTTPGTTTERTTTTPQSTTTPVSTTTTEGTTTTPQSTTTPVSTTTTTEGTTSTPQSTTTPDITTTSPTTESTTSTTQSTTTPVSTTTTTESTTTTPQSTTTPVSTTTTTESTTTTPQSTTTPVPTTTTTESTTTPTSTSQSTTTPVPTTKCIPVCAWSPWYDVSYPQYGVNGGDFETYENIKNEGFSICDKPQNISCRASKFPDTPLDELRQKVTCDVNHGLVCNNRDQEGFMPVCYNYEISVECCDLPPWCTTTTPVPTTTTTTEKTTTTPQSTTTPVPTTTTTEKTTTTPYSTTTPGSTTTTEKTTTTPQSTTTPVSTTTPTVSSTTTTGPVIKTFTTTATTQNVTSGGQVLETTSTPPTTTTKTTTTTEFSTTTTSPPTESSTTTTTSPTTTPEATTTPEITTTKISTPPESSTTTSTPPTTTTETTTTTEFSTTTTSPPTESLTTTTAPPTTTPEATTTPEITTTKISTPPESSTTTTSTPPTTTTETTTTTEFSTTTTSPPTESLTTTTAPPTTTPEVTTTPEITTTKISTPPESSTTTTSTPPTTTTETTTTTEFSTTTTSPPTESLTTTTAPPTTTPEVTTTPEITTTKISTPPESSTTTTSTPPTTTTETTTTTEFSTTTTSPPTESLTTTTAPPTTSPEATTTPEITTTKISTPPESSTTTTTQSTTTSTPPTTTTETTTETTTSATTTSVSHTTTETLTTTPCTPEEEETTPISTSQPVVSTSSVTTTTLTTPTPTPIKSTSETLPTPPETTTSVTTTPTPSVSTSTIISTPCYCVFNGITYPPGAEITSGIANATLCYKIICNDQCQIDIDKFFCGTSTTPESSTTTQSTSPSTVPTATPPEPSSTPTLPSTTPPETSTTTQSTPPSTPTLPTTSPPESSTSTQSPPPSTPTLPTTTPPETSTTTQSTPPSTPTHPTTTPPETSTTTQSTPPSTPTFPTSSSTTKGTTKSTTKPTPTKTPMVPLTTTKPGCPFEPHREHNETWMLCNCTMARCLENNTVEIVELKCEPPPKITCANGRPPIAVPDDDLCCWHWECDCVCSGWGDPHYVTFDGTYYSYQGNCTYVLVEEIKKKVENFGVYIDNYDCGERDRVSCPRNIIIRHETQTIQIVAKTLAPLSLKVVVNDNEVATPYKRYGVYIYRSGINYVLEIPELGVNITYNGLAFAVKLPYGRFRNNTQGQCGTCTNNRDDDCMTRSGDIISNCEIAADSWIVHDPTKPQCTSNIKSTISPPITLPSSSCKPSPLCELIKGDTFKKCHSTLSPEDYYQACVFDSCHVPDSNIECTSLQLYALLCADQGICVEWRNKASSCPLSCPSHKVYQACGPVVQESCQTTPKEAALIKNDTRIVEGCFCPSGTIPFSASVDVCVEISKCGCVGPDNVPRTFGENFEFDCQDCTCMDGGSGIVCKKHACQKQIAVQCDLEGFYPVIQSSSTDKCCNESICKCDTSRCSKNPVSCGLGYEAVGSIPAGHCCPVYKCVQKQVCVHGNAEYQPGSPVYSDQCQSCVCAEGGNTTTGLQIKCNRVACNIQCPLGFALVKSESDCCGRCEQTHCVVTHGGILQLLKPGNIIPAENDNCTMYSCTKIKNQFISSTSQISCQTFIESECEPDTIQYLPNGCCKICIKKSSSCKIQEFHDYLTYNNCRSHDVVKMSRCEGTCGTFSMYSAAARSMSHKCTCCQEVKTSIRQVDLTCTDGSVVGHDYITVDECDCVNTDCGTAKTDEQFSLRDKRSLRRKRHLGNH
ncbi:mucin-2 [Bombina bombina]|uniref:mucin-2 n=1 Tax=Bombina bombina TaxID=8345 RepID=UPI00235A93A9|nr:mucin-2 [Bombina bombina]